MREKFKFELENDPIKRLQLIDSGVREEQSKKVLSFMNSPPIIDYRSVDRKLRDIFERTTQKKDSLSGDLDYYLDKLISFTEIEASMN